MSSSLYSVFSQADPSLEYFTNISSTSSHLHDVRVGDSATDVGKMILGKKLNTNLKTFALVGICQELKTDSVLF